MVDRSESPVRKRKIEVCSAGEGSKKDKNPAGTAHLVWMLILGAVALLFPLIGLSNYFDLWNKPTAMWTPADDFHAFWSLIVAGFFGVFTWAQYILWQETR
jgi:hypothetical protein